MKLIFKAPIRMLAYVKGGVRKPNLIYVPIPRRIWKTRPEILKLVEAEKEVDVIIHVGEEESAV